MREMKVRVWDDVLKEMLYSHVEQFDDMLGFRFEKHLETENPIYMWSTGLHDRNGREIYEGDILKLVLIDYANEPEDVFAVQSESLCCDVCYLQSIVKFIEESRSKTDSIEVIGNIYEHPHLMKGDENA